MKKPFLIIFLQFFAEYSFCQDINWKEVQVDKFLTVSLPEDFSRSDTFLVRDGKRYDIKLLNTTLGSCTFAITVTQTDFNLNPYDSKSSDQGYKGVKNGFRENAVSKGFTTDIKDTIVNDVRGFKAILYSDDSRVIVSRVCYAFCVNDISYSIIAAPSDGMIVENAENLEKLVRSIRFKKEEILGKISVISDSTAFEVGERIGRLLAPVLLIGGIVFFIIYRTRKNKVNKDKPHNYV